MARPPSTPAIALLHDEIVRLIKNRPLPCSPCPHQSACCAYGTSLTPREAKVLLRAHGPETVYLTRWKEWRTRVRGGRCVFLVENSCTLHDSPSYPAVCRGFPLTDGSGKKPYGPYTDICPELVAPPKKLQRAVPNGAKSPR